MPKDPLGFFADESTAGDRAAIPGELTPRKIPHAPSPTSDDPGERALAGLAAGASSLTAAALPFVGRVLVQPILEKGSVEWAMPGVQDVTSFDEALRKVQTTTPKPKTKMLGLFDVGARQHPLEAAHKGAIRPAVAKEVMLDASKAGKKLHEVRDVVDSFIDKHNLAKKGVRVSLQSGPLTAIGGGRFEPATKRVYLPRVGKELALHELAHAADYTAGRLGRFRGWAEPALHKGVLAALPIALAAGDRIKEMIPGTIDDKAISFMQDHAPEIMGATLAATQLYPEAKASFMAVKHIKEKQGVAAARAAMRKLIPFWGTYLLGAIPAVVGMSLARKYMRSARAEKTEVEQHIKEELEGLEKTSGLLRDVSSGARDIGHVAREIGRGTVGLFKEPGTARRIAQAAKETGQSPEFLWGAVASAVPATLGALYMYGTPGGKVIREGMHPKSRDVLLGHTKKNVLVAAHADDKWRERHPAQFAGLVAAGAALSGGIVSKFLHDLTRVL